MTGELVTYTADGLAMQSRLFLPDATERRPAVLVFPEAFGLAHHALSCAARLAELGYVALASDLHGEAKLYPNIAEVMPVLAPIRQAPERIRARAEGGLAALLARPEVDPARIAAIGFCFGGTMAFELARGGADIRAAVGFHSGLGTAAPQDAKQIKGKILAMIGAEDPGITPEQRLAFEEEMRAGGVDWQLHVYGGVVHSFTDPEADGRGDLARFRYDAVADARSWGSMLALFEEVLA